MTADMMTAETAPSAEPGGLYVLRATRDLPVEWALLDRRGGQRLAVPADTHPLAGTGDFEVRAEALAGPLILRCRFGVWLEAEAFEPGLRTGTLAPGTLAGAQVCHHRLVSGVRVSSPLAQEADVDPEYRDWVRHVLEPARTLASAASAGGRQETERSQGRAWGSVHRLAALFALVAFGLGVWGVQQHREVGRLSAPVFDVPSEEILLGDESRGSTRLKIPPASHVLIDLVLHPSFASGEGRFEIVDAAGTIVWRGPRVHLEPAGEFKLVIRRELLPDGEYRVRLVGAAGGTLSEKAVEIRTTEEVTR
jgi:hypothetical protein